MLRQLTNPSMNRPASAGSRHLNGTSATGEIRDLKSGQPAGH